MGCNKQRTITLIIHYKGQSHVKYSMQRTVSLIGQPGTRW